MDRETEMEKERCRERGEGERGRERERETASPASPSFCGKAENVSLSAAAILAAFFVPHSAHG